MEKVKNEIDLKKIFEDLVKRVEAGNFEGLDIVTPIKKHLKEAA
tara:strand:- start:1230 stop:1361 length:132 start_codon:yes stop_codon:yes gene_type:complete